MVKEVLILQGAEEDLLEAYIHFEQRCKEVEFYQDLDEKLSLIQQFPDAGKIYCGKFRRILLKPHFSFGIYYRLHGSRLVVSAVLPLKIGPKKVVEKLRM